MDAAMDVGGWLRGLGLEKYEETFRANAIDAGLLPRLTGDDLKEIGISALGDRLRLTDAIAALAGARPGSDVPVPKSEPAQLKGPAVSAERRPITVMFCALVGSTGLGAKLDPEDWRNLVNAYLGDASAAVTGLGGHVLKRLGDGLMALFGYPQAQENDAERAVRAGLAIQRALAEINARNAGKAAPQLVARIGLDSGPVVVEATGEVFGDAPNVAARVHGVADPGSVLVTMNVQRQVAGLFVAEEQGARELRGVSEPIQLFRIIRASGARRRSSGRSLTPFVGREEELGVLARRWERARAGEGQLVLIVGEPGLGKSRLLEEFHSRRAETPHTWVEWRASQLLQNTPLHPFAEWGRLRFGGADVPAEQRLAELESSLSQVKIDAAEAAPLLAPLLDIPLPPGRSAGHAPDEMRRRQLAAIVSWAMASARTQPIVLAFEDLQWADPTSIDVMHALAKLSAQAPILILSTARPEFRPSWGMRSHHIVISLTPLDRAQVQRMVGEIASRHALSDQVIEGVSERTGGVPLFVEEVTRLLLERGKQASAHAIPPTLHQSLAARLDRLGSARPTAQIGAVLGRDFGYALLRDVAETDEPVLRASLERLAEADLLLVEGAPPQANYRFKHALIQDVAYESLLKSRRQALHKRAAENLTDNPERAVAEPEAIAHHFTKAGLNDLAIEWWGRAGEQALRRSAFQEAIAHLGRAIAMADQVAATAATSPATMSSRRVKLQTDYAHAVLWSKGWGADETRIAFERAGDLGARAELPTSRFPALYGQVVWNLMRGEIRAARHIAEQYLKEAEAKGGIGEVSVARQILGLACAYLGELAEARSQLEQALNSYDGDGDSAVRDKNGQDTGVGAKAFLAFTSLLLGDLRRARQLIGEAVGLSHELCNSPSGVMAHLYKVLIETIRNDPRNAAADAENLSTISQQRGMEVLAALSRVCLSWARGRLGEPLSGAEEVRNSLTALTSQGNRLAMPFLLGLLAGLEAAAGDFERALATVEEGFATAQSGGQHVWDAFLHRLRGDILCSHSPADAALAEDAYRTAITVAKQQGARSYELLASLSLAKFYQSTGGLAEAHAVLAPALEGFSSTPEMPEIAEAQALLERLAGGGEGTITSKDQAT
jgi:class 3 adenylate cyclase/tetratricopeptide (TPR) repeat protein